MSSTPPDPSVPPGYKPGDYIPFKDRDPNNPTSIAGQPPRSEQAAQQARSAPHDPYRDIYGYDAPDRLRLAGWGRRVLGYFFDFFLASVVGVPLYVGYYQLLSNLETTTNADGVETVSSVGDLPASTVPLLVGGALLYLAFWVYNLCIRQGRTGYSFGKSIVGIKLVGERTTLPIGGGWSFLRQLAHFVDGLICNLGYLWPIWDRKKQTFADKMLGTLVIIQPQDQPQDPAGYRAQG
jgi:uncharacterized RDD family membrane protein YckC